MPKASIAFFVSVLFFLGLSVTVFSKEAVYSTENAPANILQKISLVFTGKMKNGLAIFELTNNSGIPFAIVSNLPPKNNEVSGSFVIYEVSKNNEWQDLNVGYDGFGDYEYVSPGKNLRILVSLDPFNNKAGEQVRVGLGKLRSAPFKIQGSR